MECYDNCCGNHGDRRTAACHHCVSQAFHNKTCLDFIDVTLRMSVILVIMNHPSVSDPNLTDTLNLFFLFLKGFLGLNTSSKLITFIFWFFIPLSAFIFNSFFWTLVLKCRRRGNVFDLQNWLWRGVYWPPSGCTGMKKNLAAPRASKTKPDTRCLFFFFLLLFILEWIKI